jgi:S-layer protein
MSYTLEQLTLAYKAVHVGIAPDAATENTFQTQASLSGSGQVSDAQLLSNILNGADNSTALALVSYQFFTGKAPTAAGLAYLVNSTANPTDLNDAYYAKFNLENRYINFAANLGLRGEGAGAFSAKYAAMSFSDYVASIYETIIGSSYAQAAGIDPAAAVAYLVSTKDAVLAIARDAGMITPNMTPAQIDLGLKAAMAGLVMAAGIKADVGLYAAIANNFMVAMAQGSAAYGANMLANYLPVVESASHGTGHAVDRGMSLPFPTPTTPTAPTAMSLVLTVGVDNALGGGGGDTITGTHLTFNGTDVINGGDGNDTLTITASGGGSYIMPAASVTGVETFNLVNTADTSANTTSWTGLTQLNATTAGSTVLTTATTTNVTATVNGQGGLPVVLNGGANVSVTANGVTTGTIDIGGTTAPTGAITVNRTAAGSAGALTITGGSSVDVTQTDGAVTINGSALTTSVKVKTTGTPGAIAITDVNAGTAALGKITSVDLDGYTTASIGDSALSTLKLAHGSGAVNINSTGATSPVTTLNLTLNGVTGGALTDTNNKYATFNVTTGATASTLANINDTALTTLNLGGASRLTLTSASGMTTLSTVKITGAASLTATLSSTAITTIDASGSSGSNILTFRPDHATFLGGSGADTLTTVNGVINTNSALGGGDDTLIFLNGVSGTGSISGGSGTDTVALDINVAQTLSGSNAFAGLVTGFEVLRIDLNFLFVGDYTIDVGMLGNFASVLVTDDLLIMGAHNFELTNFASGGSLTLMGDLAAGGSVVLTNSAFAGGTNDTINLTLSKAGIQDIGALLTSGVETINITTKDTSASPTGAYFDKAPITDSALKVLNVSGNAGLDLGTLNTTHLTTLDASGLTLGGLIVTLGASSSAVTVKGSATGANTVVASALTADVTYVGGSGVDTITLSDGHNVLTLGGGADVVKIQFAAADPANTTTITDIAAGDSLSFVGTTSGLATLGAAVNVSAASSLSQALNLAAAGSGSMGATQLTWFQYGGATYVVADVNAGASFVNGSDFVVKLTGLVSLSGASVATDTITF